MWVSEWVSESACNRVSWLASQIGYELMIYWVSKLNRQLCENNTHCRWQSIYWYRCVYGRRGKQRSLLLLLLCLKIDCIRDLDKIPTIVRFGSVSFSFTFSFSYDCIALRCREYAICSPCFRLNKKTCLAVHNTTSWVCAAWTRKFKLQVTSQQWHQKCPSLCTCLEGHCRTFQSKRQLI